jgi:hypothetical protein
MSGTNLPCQPSFRKRPRRGRRDAVEELARLSQFWMSAACRSRRSGLQPFAITHSQ